MINKDETAYERWQAIPFQFRVVALFSIYLVYTAIAVFIRPANPVADFWQNEVGIRNDAIALIFIGTGFVLPLIYYLWRKLFFIALATIPVLFVYAAILWQIFTVEDAPLIHGTNILGLIIFFIFTFFLSSELDTEREINLTLSGKLHIKIMPEAKG